ncbi:MAG: tripartite tricarboxylate transporter substrate binding protein [Burkholderiales bacterium]|nr:tripartite tricarboxylate transporter substrate binding protein [Burkholderiales bacterium]
MQDLTPRRTRSQRIVAVIVAGMLPALLASASAQAAQAAGYPDKPVRLVIGSAPGSGPDIISRVMAERLYKAWNQRVVVDARPGAAGVISAELVLQAVPDGYTWMMLTSQLLVASRVIPNIKFDLDKDFASISLIGTVPFVLMVNNQLPAKSLSELIALAKKSPGALRYGSAGTGASEHLCGVMLNALTGTQMLHVPYKGVAQAIADTIANEVQLTYSVVPAARPSIQGGRLRALGVTSRTRAPLLPDVPSIAETVPGYEMLGWYSIVAPTGTPADILAKVSAEVVKAVKEPEFAEQLKGLGIDVVGSTRAELDAFRREQTKRIAGLVKAAGVDNK